MISIEKQKQIRLQPRFSGISEANISGISSAYNACADESSAEAIRAGIKTAIERAYGSVEPVGDENVAKAPHRVFCSNLCPKEQGDAILEAGGIPVFIDVTSSDYNMDPDSLETAFDIFPDTKVVVVNHLYGFPAQIQLIAEICKAHGAMLVENATESFGATYFGKEIGTFGDIGIRSRITSSDDTIQKNKQIYEYYRDHLNEDIMYVIEPCEGAEPNYSRCFLTIESCVEPADFYSIGAGATETVGDNGLSRDNRSFDYEDVHGATSPEEIYDALAAFGAEAGFVYTPMNRLDEYKKYDFVTPDGLSVSESFFDESNSDYAFRCGILLPMDASMTQDEQDRVIDIVHACFDMQNISRKCAIRI